jgi:hypothetical protein
MKKAFEIKNLRQIKVKYLPPTNYSGSRIKIYEPKRYNEDKVESKIYSYCYETGDVMEQAYNILINNGFNVICRASEQDNYIFLCDNWSNEFIKISELKK